MVQTIRDGIDKVTPIGVVEGMLERAGFQCITIRSIGDHVYQGFDRWTAQGSLAESWTRNWYKGYKLELIDYYIITAAK